MEVPNYKEPKAYTDGKESNRLVHPSQRGDIDSLTTDSSLGSDTCRIFTGTGVNDGIDQNLNETGSKARAFVSLPKPSVG